MKRLYLALLILLVSFAPHAFADGFTALAPIPGLTDQSVTSVVNATSLANFFNNLYKYLIGLAAVLAIIEIIWGGLEISTKDSVSKQSDGRERITQAIFGLILVLSPVLVFSIINPSILNLSINLQPLDTYTPPATTSGDTTQTTTTNVAGTTLSSENHIYVCQNNDCTSAYTLAKQYCAENKSVFTSSVAYLYCVPSQSNPNNLSIGSDVAPLPDQKTMAQTCPAGQTLVAACQQSAPGQVIMY